MKDMKALFEIVKWAAKFYCQNSNDIHGTDEKLDGKKLCVPCKARKILLEMLERKDAGKKYELPF